VLLVLTKHHAMQEYWGNGGVIRVMKSSIRCGDM